MAALVGCGWPLAQPRTHTSTSAPSQTRGHTGARGQHPWHTTWAVLPALIHAGWPEEEGTAKHRRRGLTHLGNCPSSLKTPLS